ncbi:MAG: pyruvate:ferredoxin (flavodoxin) oxidoreductase, partial [Polyangiales bacterium]
RARVPMLHFFDGFRTSHELATITPLSDDDLRALIDEDAIAAHRARALSPEHPVIRGTAQNPDAFFQAREAANPFHDAVPDHVLAAMDALHARTGRRYGLVEYVGDPRAERVLVAMGSGAEVAEVAVQALVARGERVGVLKVRLFRPFPWRELIAALPTTVRGVAVLDRTKEPGSIGEPLWLDVVAALAEARAHQLEGPEREPRVIGVRYGLASKEFTPAMAKAALDALVVHDARTHVTVGINDDVSRRSLEVDARFEAEPAAAQTAIFIGLGSDGTVSACKRTLDVVGEDEGRFVQSYSLYDSKKSGSVTQTFLRFGHAPIHAPWLPTQAQFVAIAHVHLLERQDLLSLAAPGATLLLGARGTPEQVWSSLPAQAQSRIIDRSLAVIVVDLEAIATEAGLPGRLGTLLQACFFELTDVLPQEIARARLEAAIREEFGKREAVVQKNLAGMALARTRMRRLPIVHATTTTRARPPTVAPEAPSFVQRVTSMLLEGRGDLLPVSAFPPDGTWPSGTARWEKRRLAKSLPVWTSELCVACNLCTLLCPHAAIRAKVVALDRVPDALPHLAWKSGDLKGQAYLLALSPDDCTGCTVCVEVCPAHAKSDPTQRALTMRPVDEVRSVALTQFAEYQRLPSTQRTAVHLDVKGGQLLEPLFEYSGACNGCGETPYLKLVSQLFGDRALVANATGCSSIFGGNLPTTPWCSNESGRGPAWANSLFEDDAEFGLGFRLAVDAHATEAARLLRSFASTVGEQRVAALTAPCGHDEAALEARRAMIAEVKARLGKDADRGARRLLDVIDALVPRSVWIVGGDGWAYDIGFGGLDHVISGNHDVNILVLDTEVYSNTGGQQSKATPLGATARYAASGRDTGKKDLGLMAMTYGHVYVAKIALAAKPEQAMRALREAEGYPGPSLVIAYSPCIAHGYDLGHGPEQQKLAVECGAWPLYRYDPRRADKGQPPLSLDSAAPTASIRDYMAGQTRFSELRKQDPERHAMLVTAAEAEVVRKRWLYEKLAQLSPPLAAAIASS